MAGTTSPAALVLHGYLDLPLDTQGEHAPGASPYYCPTEAGQVAVGLLVLGWSQANGHPARLRNTDPRYWRVIEAAARENAQFCEEAQRGAAA